MSEWAVSSRHISTIRLYSGIARSAGNSDSSQKGAATTKKLLSHLFLGGKDLPQHQIMSLKSISALSLALKRVSSIFVQFYWIGLDWIEQCFTSTPTQYRLYGRRFLQVKRPNQQYQNTEGNVQFYYLGKILRQENNSDIRCKRLFSLAWEVGSW